MNVLWMNGYCHIDTFLVSKSFNYERFQSDKKKLWIFFLFLQTFPLVSENYFPFITLSSSAVHPNLHSLHPSARDIAFLLKRAGLHGISCSGVYTQ